MSNVTLDLGHSKLIVPRDRLVRALVKELLDTVPVPAGSTGAQELAKGEHYAGILLGKNGEPDNHVILLPGDMEDMPWQKAIEWATGSGGQLPTRREQALLYANLPEQFKKDSYWSCEQHAEYADHAWSQFFGDGTQHYWSEDNQLRARAVRRLVIR